MMFCYSHSIFILFIPFFFVHSSIALPPDDFQLFGTIFFVLFAIGLVLSAAFASALYFFYWYGQKKTGQQQMGENKAAIPIKWINYSRGGEEGGIRSNEETIPSSQQFYSPYQQRQQDDEEKGNAQRRYSISYLPGHGLASSPSPSHTIFPTTMKNMYPPPPSPPSYISAQSPELVHFPKWTNDAHRQLPSEKTARKQPKSILKKPKIRSNRNRGMPSPPVQKSQPILVPVQRGKRSEFGRKPPPIPRKWKWNIKLEDGGSCERVVEDRIEREESCVQGKLVSVERGHQSCCLDEGGHTPCSQTGEKGQRQYNEEASSRESKPTTAERKAKQ